MATGDHFDMFPRELFDILVREEWRARNAVANAANPVSGEPGGAINGLPRQLGLGPDRARDYTGTIFDRPDEIRELLCDLADPEARCFWRLAGLIFTGYGLLAFFAPILLAFMAYTTWSNAGQLLVLSAFGSIAIWHCARRERKHMALLASIPIGASYGWVVFVLAYPRPTCHYLELRLFGVYLGAFTLGYVRLLAAEWWAKRGEAAQFALDEALGERREQEDHDS